MVETRTTTIIDAPPSVIFKAPADEAELVHWMHKEAKMDVRVGGEYEFKFHWEARDITAVARERYSN